MRYYVFLAMGFICFQLSGQETVLVGTSTKFSAGTIYQVKPDGTNNEIWYEADLPQQAYDVQLIAIEDRLFGTTSEGGSSGDGLVFSINKDGSDYTILHEFSDSDGATPFGGVTLYDGRLWGTCRDGGSEDRGSIYSLNTDGTDFQKVHDFAGSGSPTVQLIVIENKLFGTQAAGPFSFNPATNEYLSFDIGGGSPRKLLLGSDGLIYGVTGFGGSNFSGTLYSIQPDGSNYTVLHEFGFDVGNIGFPFSSLVERDGVFYGGTFNEIFSIGMDGTGLQVIYAAPQGVSIDDPNDFSRDFRGGLVESNGKFWGLTFSGGTSMDGTLISFNTDGTNFMKVKDFSFSDGSEPWNTFLLEDGRLWGISSTGGDHANGTIFSFKDDGTDFQKIHDFDDTNSDGRRLTGELIQVENELWGVAETGGLNNAGTVFQIDIFTQEFTKIHDFNVQNGANPTNGLIQFDGKLWGLTKNGGANDAGIIYSLGLDGSAFTKLHDFDAPLGANPVNKLTPIGNQLWGTTEMGGSNDLGTVFRINPDGTSFEVLHHFSDEDGRLPRGTLVESAGRVWGTTYEGPTRNFGGTIFSMSTNGDDFRIDQELSAMGDGQYTEFGLTVNDDRLWGASQRGGTNNNGFIFSIKNDGSDYTIHHNFEASGLSDRASSLTLFEGKFYGMYDERKLYSIDEDGTNFTSIYSFSDNELNQTQYTSLLPVFIKGVPSLSLQVSMKTYGEEDFQLAPLTNSSAEISYTSSDEEVVAVSATGLARIIGAGSATIAVSQDENEDYLGDSIEETIEVQKANLRVTADDQTIDFGEPIPDLTITYEGFVNEETVAVLDVLPGINTTATGESMPGTYVIEVDGGSDDNYELELTNGELIILPVLGLPESRLFTVYPNPSSGLFNFSGEVTDLIVEVRDLSGKQVLIQKEPQLNLSNYPSGKYLLIVYDGDQLLGSVKVIVK